ncbi:hypothetical protein ABI59_07555 [Acidobacteria bacterium Mor1]|nr:hypothetical protein ABI59_07555 [Acidobacteria bacterium Mor1]
MDLDKIGEWLDSVDRKLKDPSLARDLHEAKLSKPVALKLQGATFTLDGKAGIHVHNSKDDTDEDGVLLTKEGESLETDHHKIPPQISFKPSKVWLKYRAEATAKGSASRSLEDLGFSLDGNAGVSLSSYRVHGGEEKLKDAVLGDLKSLKTILSARQVRELEIGEAVSMRAHGRIEGSLTFAWSDVFTTQMSVLTDTLATNETLGIKVGANASADVTFRVNDEFVLTFARDHSAHVRVAVRKAKDRRFGAKLSASVGVEFADPRKVQEVLKPVLEGVLGEPESKIEEILAFRELDDLSERQREIAEKVIDRLGLDDAFAELEDLRDEVKALRVKLEGLLKQAAELKAKIGLSYEYSRVRQKTSLLQAKIANNKISGYHAPLVKGKLRPILDDIDAGAAGVSLESYMNQDSLKVRRAFGFSLGIGKWWSLSDRSEKELDETVDILARPGEETRSRVSFRGLSAFEVRAGRNQKRISGDLSASMDDFSASLEPKANEFDFGFHLMFQWGERKLKRDEIPLHIDHAMLWRALAPEEREDWTAQVGTGFGDKQDVEMTCQVKFDDTAFRWFIMGIGEDQDFEDARFGQAMGAAMPWTDRKALREVRQSEERRRRYYGALWTRYLQSPSMQASGLEALAKENFRAWRFPKVARFEGAGNHATSMGMLVARNTQMRRRWKEFHAGCLRLQRAILDRKPYTEIRKAYRSMRPLWSNELLARALGIYMLDRASEGAPSIKAGVERVLTVTRDANNASVLTISLS